jgi:glycosyltransferase involved in cell wall biosynthesis
MRFLLDATQIRVGGAIQVALNILINAGMEAAHEFVAVVSPELRGQLPGDLGPSLREVRVAGQRRQNAATRIVAARWLLKRTLEDYRPDLVFTIFGPPYWTADTPHVSGFAIPALLYPEVQRKLGVSLAERWAERLKNRLKSRGLRRATHFIVETETVRLRLATLHGIPTNRIFVVPNGISHLFARCAKPRTTVERPCCTVLIPSAYYNHKNLAIIPQVAASLKDRLSCRFVMMLDPGGPPWKRISREAAKLGVASSIVTVGVVPHAEIRRLYDSADCVFLPSWYECSTAVYPESFSAGVPVCTSDLDFAREACGSAAVYFDPASPAAAAEALLRVLTEPVTRAGVIAAGQTRLTSLYPTPEVRWRQLLSCLTGIAAV